MEVNIVNIFPKSTEIVLGFCNNCSSSYKMKETTLLDNIIMCSKCINENKQQKLQLYFNLRLTVRFESNNNQYVHLFLSTFDEEGNGFLGLDPGDTYRNFEYLQKLQKSIQTIISQECYFVAVCVSRISEGVYRIMGKYNNLLQL